VTATLHRTAGGWWLTIGGNARLFNTETAARDYAKRHGLEII
jgi:hypothetical protein